MLLLHEMRESEFKHNKYKMIENMLKRHKTNEIISLSRAHRERIAKHTRFFRKQDHKTDTGLHMRDWQNQAEMQTFVCFRGCVSPFVERLAESRWQNLAVICFNIPHTLVSMQTVSDALLS